jgi:hypothetical protein
VINSKTNNKNQTESNYIIHDVNCILILFNIQVIAIALSANNKSFAILETQGRTTEEKNSNIRIKKWY